MSMRYVRTMYGVPAFRGAAVTYKGQPARITSASHYVNIRLESGPEKLRVHPTDPALVYLQKESTP